MTRQIGVHTPINNISLRTSHTLTSSNVVHTHELIKNEVYYFSKTLRLSKKMKGTFYNYC